MMNGWEKGLLLMIYVHFEIEFKWLKSLETMKQKFRDFMRFCGLGENLEKIS